MKKLLLCFTAMFMINAASAQTWCPPGAKWHFKRGQPFSNSGIDGIMQLAYTGDVTQLGVSCKKLDAIFTGNTGWPQSPVVTQNFNTYYTHLTNGVLHILNGNRFDTIVNFNALPGDKWLRPGFDSVGGVGCNSRRPYTVIDTGHVLVNGFNLKKVTASYSAYYSVLQTTYTFVVQHTFVERLLFINSTPYNLFPIDCERDNMFTEFPQTSFRCYEDNSFPLYNVSDYGCSSLTGIRTIGSKNVDILVYPNPVNNLLTLELPDAGNYTVQLADLLGNTWPLAMSETGEQRMQADMSRFEPGLYFMQVYEKDGLVATEKLIKK